MISWLLILIPATGLILFLGWRLVAGRPLSRRNSDLLFALLLLFYFAVTAGLGIFWVANQELPPFDLHYLFGYATLVVVVIHVGLNWRRLLNFFSRRTANSTTSREGGGWRPGRRAFGWIVTLSILATISFALGVRQGSRTLVVSSGTVVADTTQTGSGIPAPPARQWIEEDGELSLLADYFHRQTAHTRMNIASGAGINWSLRPEPFKDYGEARTVPLPGPQVSAGQPTGASIVNCRTPAGGFLPEAVTLQDLATILFMTNGITKSLETPRGSYLLRSAPSAGALYPTAIYVVAQTVTGLASGLYYYHPSDNALYEVAPGSAVVAELATVVADGRLVQQAPVTLVFTTVFPWINWKYRERSYRYCGLDAGHLAVQADLALTALGYRSHLIGRFADAELNHLLGNSDQPEFGLLVFPIGRPDPEADPTGAAVRAEPGFFATPREIKASDNPLMYLIHGRTELSRGANALPRPRPATPQTKSYPGTELVPLPQPLEPGDDLFTTIGKRRSLRSWTANDMTLADLSSLMFHAFGLSTAASEFWTVDSARPDPSVEDSQALQLYLLINRVSGIEPGIYYYHRGLHALSRLQAGDLHQVAYEASLFQEVVGNAQVTVIFTADQQRLGSRDGDRDYRYANLDAGMLGGRLYLQATALGLGCCGIGAYFDQEINDLIRVPPEQELVLYCCAVGIPDTAPE
ncbi:MAG: SagB family peptide dehydrogenase [bacterium]